MKRFWLSTLSGAALALGLNAPALAQVVSGGTVQTIYDANGNSLSFAGVGSLAPAGTPGTAGVSGGKSTAATGNSVTLTSGTLDNVFGAVNFSDSAVASLNHNQATVNGGSVGNNGGEYVAGAYYWILDGDPLVSYNTVTVNGGTLNAWVYGALARSDHSGDPTADHNSVNITGGTFTDGNFNDAYGGDAHSYCNGIATANYNSVNIEDGSTGTFNGNIFGGYAYSHNDHCTPPAADAGTANATGNTVIVGAGLPATTFSSTTTWLYGGYVDAIGSATSTGNTLQMKSAGLTVEGVDYFQNFSFTLPAGLANGGTMLTVTNAATVGTNATTGAAVVTVDASALTLHPSDEFFLINGAAATPGVTGFVATASQSGTLIDHTGSSYAYTVGISGKQLWLKIGSRIGLVADSATAVPATSDTALAMLGLCLAALAAVALRRKA